MQRRQSLGHIDRASMVNSQDAVYATRELARTKPVNCVHMGNCMPMQEVPQKLRVKNWKIVARLDWLISKRRTSFCTEFAWTPFFSKASSSAFTAFALPRQAAMCISGVCWIFRCERSTFMDKKNTLMDLCIENYIRPRNTSARSC